MGERERTLDRKLVRVGKDKGLPVLGPLKVASVLLLGEREIRERGLVSTLIRPVKVAMPSASGKGAPRGKTHRMREEMPELERTDESMIGIAVANREER